MKFLEKSSCKQSASSINNIIQSENMESILISHQGLSETVKGSRILVVDDNKATLNIIQQFLSDYNVKGTNHSKEGLELARNWKPDLILCDLFIPELTGDELCRLLKQDPQTKDIPFVLISSSSESEAKIKGLTAGADDFLVKPFSPKELQIRVQYILTIFALRNELIESNRVLSKRNYQIKQDLQLAKKIQQTYIPVKYPLLEGVTIKSLYLPLEDLGGDFFTLPYYDDQRLCLFLGDVSGHGVPAALITSMLMMACKSLDQHYLDPSIYLTEINHYLYNNTANNYVTAFYCVINYKEYFIQYCIAGHPPSYLLRSGQKPITLKGKGRVLGVLDDLEYQAYEMQLQKGDLLVLYTDGLIEATNAEFQQYGEDRLTRFLNHFSQNYLKELSSVESFINLLLEDIRAFTKNEQFQDDLVILALYFD